jgi:hypothetical protein
MKKIILPLLLMILSSEKALSNNDYSAFENRLNMPSELSNTVLDKTSKEYIESQKYKKFVENSYSFDGYILNPNSVGKLVLNVTIKKKINKTIMDRYIQNNKILNSNKVVHSKKHIMIKTSSLNINRQLITISKMKFDKNCFIFDENGFEIKFCNFNTIAEIKAESLDFLSITGYSTK